MTDLKRCPARVACAVGLLFTVFATPSAASVIYEFREIGSSAVSGTLEIASPPAIPTMAWSTTDASDLIALSLDNLGTGNLLSAAASLGGGVVSLDGSTLDLGGIGITFPTIVPSLPTDPIIDRVMSLHFSGPAGSDFIGVATTFRYSDGTVLIGDLFLDGDWTVAAVPEPAISALLAIAFAAAVGASRRRRR